MGDISGAKVHGVVTSVGGGGGEGPVHHDDIIEAVGKVTDILPLEITGDLTNEELLDFGFEALGEVKA